jgi:NAD-dependent dihydropyrimidine dehydrogenase PreA subunit
VILRYLRNVVTLKYNDARCIGCGRCIDVCPHAVFVMDGKRARIVDRDACMECGACAKNCPTMAVSVDSGVGCASALIKGALTGANVNCDCCCGE